MFTFTPLLGAQSSSSRASSSILELDGGIKILVDVGWDDTFDTRDLTELEKHIPTLSLILLTHATSAHIGAFVHCCRTFPLFSQIPIYATSPVIALGRTSLQDLYASAPLAATFLPNASVSEPGAAAAASAVSSEEGTIKAAGSTGRILLQPPTTEEIARYFSLIQPLKYSQPHQPSPSPFSPPLDGLTLTAYNAGHTVGGTIWHIQHGMESIVYAMDWNQAREGVVAGAAWFGGSGASGTEVIESLRKPTALICSSKGGDKFAPSGGRKKRDEHLLDMIRSSLAKGGTVLIPTDTSARVLELVYSLEHAWRDAAAGEKDDVLSGAGLYLAGRKVNTTLRLARSMLEWMDENIVREFEAAEGADAAGQRAGGQGQDKNSGKGVGPFTFKHLKTVERKKRLEKLLTDQGPKVILASDTSLAWGFSKESLRRVAEGPNNLLLLTESFRTKVPDVQEAHNMMSIGSIIWQWYEERRDGVALEKASDGELLEQVHSGGRELTWTDVQRAPLDVGEQLLYQQYLATKRQLQDTSQPRGQETLETAADALDDRSSSTSSEDSDSEQQGRVLNFSAALAHSNRSKLALTDEDLGINVLLRRKNVYDYDVRGKKGRERMFPYVTSRKKGDEYGEFIRPEEYLRAEEREEIDMQQRRSEAQTKLGQKRRWDEAAGSGGLRLSGGAGGRKRQQVSKDGQRVDSGAGDDLSLASDEAADGAVSSEDEVDGQAFEGPAKAVYKKESFTINARIAFIDCMGLHDKRSLEMLIPLIQPQKLILVGGMKEETSTLAAECKKLLAAKAGIDVSAAAAEAAAIIFTPVNGEQIDASVDTNAWMVKLSNNLVRRLNWQHVRSLGVVALTAQLRGPEIVNEDENADADASGKKMKLVKDETASSAITPTTNHAKSTDKLDAVPLLDTLPASMAAGTRSVTRPLHVGDLRLADLRKLMQAAGHTAEFRGEGTLLIDKSVAVRKSGTGKIEVEASAQSSANRAAQGRGAGSFLAVKRKIYEGLAVVAGN
ncbi:uncharacterized protein N7498_003494 [Penicillium cinerascens]|uniref:Cleavage and polyadenylation specificity factor subunit 2 n=1 Tax=Penicillium cinerascens TaxID=70096 RepID=A0A9W9T6Y6_9EURO|nr:uncharacterized protein N7498_003494 [Penicillium cinerascens]KAJ5211848.1 hypothetical protein N7498_003494 [Penicillium cinerascens]